MFKAVNNLLGLQQEKKSFAITPELIRSIIDEIEADPYEGLGGRSKKDRLVERLCAVFRVHDCIARGVPVTQARPILSEPPAEAREPASNVTVTKPAAPKPAPAVEQKALAV